MRRCTSTGILAALIGLSTTGLLHANAQITGQHVYNDGDGSREQSHVDYHIDVDATCGVLVDNKTRLSLQQSTIGREEFCGQDHLTSDVINNALVCAINEADLYIDHDAFEFSAERAAGVWASGLNTTAHLSNLRLTSHADVSWGMVAENQSAIMASNIEYDSDAESSCGFVAVGGSVTVDNSVIYADGVHSAGFCLEDSDIPSGAIHARAVTASSQHGLAVWLYGAARQVSFTNCTLVGGGDAAILSASKRGGHPFPLDLNIIDSTVMATNEGSPVLHYAVADSTTHIYNSNLIPAGSDLVVVTCSPTAFENCTEFQTNITISESQEPSHLRWELTSYTKWTGSIVNTPNDTASSAPDVFLDNTSIWNVTQDSHVRGLVSALGNVSNIHAAEPGVTVRYNAGIEENAYLRSQAYEIEGGGFVQPYLC